MIPTLMTRRGGPEAPPGRRGDCFGACLASIFEVPMGQMPPPPPELDIRTHDSSPWWDHYAEVVRDFGAIMLHVDEEAEFERMLGFMDWTDSYWIAAVPSLNIPSTEAVPVPLHAVVCRGVRIDHDPSRAKKYERYAPVEPHLCGVTYFTFPDPARR